jgi:hypothetical protein
MDLVVILCEILLKNMFLQLVLCRSISVQDPIFFCAPVTSPCSDFHVLCPDWASAPDWVLTGWDKGCPFFNMNCRRQPLVISGPCISSSPGLASAGAVPLIHLLSFLVTGLQSCSKSLSFDFFVEFLCVNHCIEKLILLLSDRIKDSRFSGSNCTPAVIFQARPLGIRWNTCADINCSSIRFLSLISHVVLLAPFCVSAVSPNLISKADRFAIVVRSWPS